MDKFNTIYPFTTENIAGYMDGMNLTNKRIITVTGSGDHVINSIYNGSSDIVTFDINPLTKYYLDLKLAAIKELPFDVFLKVFLYRSIISLDSKLILGLKMEESKEFFKQQLLLYGNNGLEFKRSSLFHISYFSPEQTIKYNLYLNRRRYNVVKKRIENVRISFINSDLRYLELDEDYDVMFLSNISDYINDMYESNSLREYNALMNKFLLQVKKIYIAYLYDIGSNHVSDIYDLDRVRREIPGVRLDTFSSVYNNGVSNKRDGVLVLSKNI